VSANDGLILREDAALKSYLQGMTVRDGSSGAVGREVKVYFRLPEQEAQRREYPYITIDLLNIARDPERETRGSYRFRAGEEYMPPTRVLHDRAVTEWPIPLLFTYQITSFARFVQHDRQIMASMMTTRLVERFGAVPMVGTNEVGDDHSVRRLDLINGPQSADQPDPGDPNKRIFRKAWTVQMSSEYFPAELSRFIATSDIAIEIFDFLLELPNVVKFRGSGSLVVHGF
jgi:hypothetical protein